MPATLQRYNIVVPLSKIDAEANGAPIHIIYAGTFHLGDYHGTIEITEQMIDEMVRNFNDLEEQDRVPINVNHSGGQYTLDEAGAVGWIVDLYKETQDDRISLMAKPRWLEETKEFIENERFRFCSAELVFNDVHPVTGEDIGSRLFGAAITCYPAIPQLDPIALTAHSPNDLETKVAITSTKLIKGSIFDYVENVFRAFYRKFPDTNLSTYWIEDAHETHLIVRAMGETDSCYFQVNYTLTDDGVDFTPQDEWIEVEHVYVPLTLESTVVKVSTTPKAQAWSGSGTRRHPNQGANIMDIEVLREMLDLEDADEGAVMAALTALKDRASQIDDLTEQIETLQAQLTEIQATQADGESTLTAKTEEVVHLTQQAEALKTENDTLADRVKALESDRINREGNDLIDRALKDRKLLPAEVAEDDQIMRKLAFEQPELFRQIVENRPVYTDLFTEDGSGDAVPVTNEDTYWELVREKMKGGLNQTEARKAVSEEHPEYRGIEKGGE